MIASTDLLNTLAWSLLHFVWQGAAIAGLSAALLYVFRKPDARYLIGIAALALMVASFAVTFALVDSAGNVDSPSFAARAPAAALASPQPDAVARSVSVLAGSQAAIDSSEVLWIARLWLVGVSLLALRIAFGLIALEQVRRRGLIELPPALVARFRALQARLGIHRDIRYAECPRVGVPAVIGFFRPIVLLPMRALIGLTPEQLEAVVAHELGHIKRFDVAVNFLQMIAETLFFFHPAVWWLNRRIRAHREDCCDDVAVRACGERVGYARALATMAGWRDVPTLAMASTGGPVAARVARLLGIREPDSDSRSASMVTASLILATALIAGTMSVGLVQPAFAEAEPEVADIIDPALEFELAEAAAIAEATNEVTIELGEPTAPEAVTATFAQVAPLAPLDNVTPPAPLGPMPIAPVPAIAPSPAPAPMPFTDPTPVAEPSAPAPPPPPAPALSKSYIEEMKLAGLGNLDADMLVAFKNHDITVDFVHEMQKIDVRVEPEIVLSLRIHGVTPEYVQSIRKLGFDPGAEDVVSMKIHDIGADYVNEMRKLGFKPDAEELVAMKVHGVTPQYVNEVRALGFEPGAQQLIEMKVFGITPAFIDQARAHGFKNLSIQQLVQLKNAQVL